MSLNWRWCLKLGLLVVLIDLVSIALGQAAGGAEDAIALAGTVDNIANLVIFGYVGWHTGRLTGRATASAEAGVVTSLLPGIAAALLQLVLPASVGATEPTAEALPLINALIAAVAFNIALGGGMAWLAGLLATRSRGSRPS
jgi:hypothetical protein